MRAGMIREWLLNEGAWPDLPFPAPPPRRPADYAVRIFDVTAARLARRNPPPPPWRKRAIQAWQQFGAGPGPVSTAVSSLLYGAVAAWNEDDIIYATVRHLTAQGCSKVFVIDDHSSDLTVDEARAAGATVILADSDGVYSEAVRSRRLSELITVETGKAGTDIWWLIADADEFPRGVDGLTIRAMVRQLPGWVDVVGSRVVEHLPHPGAAYQPRSHPVLAFPLAHLYKSPYCPLGHWKHQLFRSRAAGEIIPMPGQHVVSCCDGRRAREWPQSLLMHHVPLRARERTAHKLTEATLPQGRYARSPDSFTQWRIKQRMHMLDLLYEGKAHDLPNGFAGESRSGIHLTDWRSLVPVSERQIEGWD